MGLNVKKIHGKEFLYFLYEKKSILLGPKGEYEKGNLENVKIAIKRNDTKVDKVLQKYMDDMTELSHYMPEPERKEYLSKRSSELLTRLRPIKQTVQKVTKEEISSKDDVDWQRVENLLFEYNKNLDEKSREKLSNEVKRLVTKRT